MATKLSLVPQPNLVSSNKYMSKQAVTNKKQHATTIQTNTGTKYLPQSKTTPTTT